MRRGRTFVSTGPLLFLDVDGRGPGEELALPAGGSAGVRVRAEALSITPLDSLQIIVNGLAVRTVRARDSSRITFQGTVPLPRGGWLAARALGPGSRYVGDDYAFAHTGPVYVVRGGQTFRSAADVRFLAETVDSTGARAARAAWRSERERARFAEAVSRARAVYARLLREAEAR